MIERLIWLVSVALVSASLGLACDRSGDGKDPKNPSEEQPTQASPALEQARKEGFLMMNLKDVQALTRITETYFEDTVLPPNAISADLARELGEDLQGIKELTELGRLNGLQIERIELIPDLGGSPDFGGGNSDTFGGSSGWSPALPSKGSLVMQSQSGNVTGWSRVNTGNERSGTNTYRDGSTWTVSRTTAPDGTVKAVEFTVTKTGEVQHSHVVVFRPGEAPEEHAQGTTENPSQAEQARQNQPPRQPGPFDPPQEDNGNGDDSGGADDDSSADDSIADEGSTDDPTSESLPRDDVGSFCPLTIEICRRALEEALASQKDVLIGMIHINPGDPDLHQANAPRLIYDPQGLVINPDPNATSGGIGGPPPRFDMGVTGLVNPPGPGEEPDP